jgi:L-aspartate oxidase
MKNNHFPDEQSDILVIGSGVAGLFFALELDDSININIVTKREPSDSNTNYAQGGIAAVVDPLDSSDLHVKDTLQAGAGLCALKAVEILVEEGPHRIQELLELGLEFTRDEKSGDLDLGREGGHSRNRIVHAKDFTGKVVESALLKKIEAKKISVSLNTITLLI